MSEITRHACGWLIQRGRGTGPGTLIGACGVNFSLAPVAFMSLVSTVSEFISIKLMSS